MSVLVTQTPPSAEPLTVGDVATKLHIRVDTSDDDALIESYIAAAREYIEGQTHLRLMTQTVRLNLRDFWPVGACGIVLPVGPIQAVSAVRYMDAGGLWQTLSADSYELMQSKRPAQLRPAYGLTWPAVRTGQDAVQIDLVVGFGDAQHHVPPGLLQAMRLIVAHWYGPAGRESATAKSMSEIPFGVAAMIGPHRLWI
jgi:phage conserved hypothetical protein, phiE125 gp8 family